MSAKRELPARGGSLLPSDVTRARLAFASVRQKYAKNYACSAGYAFSTGELAGTLHVRLQNEWVMFPTFYNLRIGTYLKTVDLEIPAMP